MCVCRRAAARLQFLRKQPQLWTPLIFSAADRSTQQAGNFSDMMAIARLQPGRVTTDATGELGAIAHSLDGLKEILDVTGFKASVKPLRSICWSSASPR